MIGTRSANFHQGQRSCAPRKQAGHMSALDPLAETSKKPLAPQGPSTQGTMCSRFPYDAAARHALQSVNLRRPAILRYATWEAASRFRGMSGYLSIAALSVDPGIDAMCHELTLKIASKHIAEASLLPWFSPKPASRARTTEKSELVAAV